MTSIERARQLAEDAAACAGMVDAAACAERGAGTVDVVVGALIAACRCFMDLAKVEADLQIDVPLKLDAVEPLQPLALRPFLAAWAVNGDAKQMPIDAFSATEARQKAADYCRRTYNIEPEGLGVEPLMARHYRSNT